MEQWTSIQIVAFKLRLLIFDTINIYGVLNTTNVSDDIYYTRVKGQGQLSLKFVLACNANLTEGVHI